MAAVGWGRRTRHRLHLLGCDANAQLIAETEEFIEVELVVLIQVVLPGGGVLQDSMAWRVGAVAG